MPRDVRRHFGGPWACHCEAHGREAAYFSLYEIGDKGTSWIGPTIFAIVRNETKSYRSGLLSLVGLFVIGMILLYFVNVKKATEEAAQG